MPKAMAPPMTRGYLINFFAFDDKDVAELFRAAKVAGFEAKIIERAKTTAVVFFILDLNCMACLLFYIKIGLNCS